MMTCTLCGLSDSQDSYLINNSYYCKLFRLLSLLETYLKFTLDRFVYGHIFIDSSSFYVYLISSAGKDTLRFW